MFPSVKAANAGTCDLIHASDGSSHYELDPCTEEYHIDMVGPIDYAPGPTYPSGPCPVLCTCDPGEIKSPTFKGDVVHDVSKLTTSSDRSNTK